MAQMSIVTSKQKKAASHREWTSAEKRTVKFPRDAGNEDELPMQPGETIALINYYSELEFEEDGDSLPDWCFGRKKSGSSGYFYLPFTEEATEESQTVYTESSNTSASYKKALMKFNTSQLHRVVFKEVPYYSTEKPADDLECIICKNLTDDPHQTDCCGHSMCYNCGTKWQKKRNSCPHCRHSPFSIVKDARTKRLIAGLTMRCKYYTKGCAWIGGINELSSHLDSDCHFETTECLQCSMQLVRQDLQVHTETACKERLISCPCCSDDYTYDELVTEHYEECPDWPMRCPNKCPQDNLTRACLQAHLDEDCPEQVIPCQFSEAGCEVRVKRREIEEHLQNSVGQHMADMMRDYIKLKKELNQSKEDYRIVAIELTQCKNGCSAVKEELAQCKEDYHVMAQDLTRCKGDYNAVKKTLSAVNEKLKAVQKELKLSAAGNEESKFAQPLPSWNPRPSPVYPDSASYQTHFTEPPPPVKSSPPKLGKGSRKGTHGHAVTDSRVPPNMPACMPATDDIYPPPVAVNRRKF